MKIRLYFLILCFLSLGLRFENVIASTNDFYFKDFTADYYLSKDEEGVSKLHVKEVLTAVFPEIDQNHGITRSIPYLNQNGHNRTIKSQEALNISVKRNGEPEKIHSINEVDGFYYVYIGNASQYVHGEQVYTLEYDFTNVITEFDENQNNVSGHGTANGFQELYWDTNGTGWDQKFEKLTARLHVDKDIVPNLDTKEAWCYVGSYGKSGGECEVKKTEDGFSFTTKNLGSGENLTFVTQFKPLTFNVVVEESYILVIILVILVIVLSLLMMKKIKKWRKEAKTNYELYKSLFVAPEYQPPADKKIHVAEGEQIYLKSTESSYVASLLELAVSHKISITKKEKPSKAKSIWKSLVVRIGGNADNSSTGSGKYSWVIHIDEDPSKFSEPQMKMLQILAGKSPVNKDDEIEIKKHKPTKTLADYAESYTKLAKTTLVDEGYLKDTKTPKGSDKIANIIALVFLKMIGLGFFAIMFLDVFYSVIVPESYVTIIGVEYLPIIIIAIIIIYMFASTILKQKTDKYSNYTEEGIRLARYLEGLELYIKMAEADRLKFLQSVDGADTSNAGIVKLYEKLLPWASLFGREESWVNELSEYYKIEDVPETISPDLLNGIIASHALRDINNVVQASTAYTPPSSHGYGGGSSFSSGGGGGGFSGGGGGGGGGGGW